MKTQRKILIIFGILLIIPLVFALSATSINLATFHASGHSNILYPVFTNNCNFTSSYNSVSNQFVTIAQCPNYNGNPITIFYNNSATILTEDSHYIIATGNSSVSYVYQSINHVTNFANGAYVIDKINHIATFSVGSYGPSVIIKSMPFCSISS